MKIFPKEVDFYELFNSASENLISASKELIGLLKNLDNIEDISKTIHGLEKEGDLITHEIMRRLNKTFLTPIDREDIHALASALDDILDLIWAAADRIKIFKIKSLQDGAIDLADTLLRSIETISKAIHNLKLKKYSYIQDLCIGINSLENEGDRVFKASLGKLFETERDPINVIKWKEIFEDLEKAVNKCEDVADILEAVVLKYA